MRFFTANSTRMTENHWGNHANVDYKILPLIVYFVEISSNALTNLNKSNDVIFILKQHENVSELMF